MVKRNTEEGDAWATRRMEEIQRDALDVHLLSERVGKELVERARRFAR